MGDNFFGITDPGRLRTNNEDSFIAQTVFNGQCIIACVIDGVGGYAGGELAAKITRDAIIQSLEDLPADMPAHMVAAFEYANERIFKEKEASEAHEKMACVVTLAIVDIDKNKFYYAHVGDTRLYLFRDNSLVKITNDHSTVGFLEESGRLTEAAAMAHPKRNEVNKALGYETRVGLAKDFIDTGESPFLPGDTILLCSDGLTDMIPTSKVIEILNSEQGLATKGKHLIDAANDAGGRDNVTVVLVHNDKSPVQHAITKPIAVAKKNHNTDSPVQLASEVQNDVAIGFQENVAPPKKSPVSILILLCIILLAALAWYFVKDMQRPKEPKLLMPPPAKKERSIEEKKMLDSINSSSLTATVNLTGSAVYISDSIIIRNDSLHIKGNGHSVTRDSTYTGPAFILASSCKYLLLDSLKIENFDIGVLVRNKGLHLKNVEFKNCRVPVSFEYQLAQNGVVSGSQAETLFYQVDSVAKR